MALVSLFIGILAGMYIQSQRCSEADKSFKDVQASISKFSKDISVTKTILSMEKTLETVGYVVAIDDPYDYKDILGSKYKEMIQIELDKLDELDLKAYDEPTQKHIKFLKKKAKELINNIEFKYIDS